MNAQTPPRLEQRKVSTLKAHPDGISYIETGAPLALANLFKVFGFLRPPFVLNERTGNLLDGDQFLDAVRVLQLDEVPVWIVDVPEELEDAAHLALQNRVSTWNWQGVGDLLKALESRGQALSLTGFPAHITAPLVAADWTPPVEEGAKTDDQAMLFG
jgi:ParB-like chromosome segregation protein Spo0J